MDQPDIVENHVGPVATKPTDDRAAPTLITSPKESPPKEPLSSARPDSPSAFAPMGAALAPVLVEVCGRRLTPPRWFRTDWQRGGALTGFSTWTDERGQQHDTVVKMPVPPVERRWLVDLSSDEITPRVFAHGGELGGYDLAWVVMERLPYGPIGKKWGADGIRMLCEAAAAFYTLTSAVPIEPPPPHRDWHAQLKRARDHVSKTTVRESQRWRKALKGASKKLDKWLEVWRAREMTSWRHGDLHLGNAMSRHAPPGGPAVLIDLPSVGPGHWVEDAVYFEHLYWANPAGLYGHKPAKLIARQLHALGLSPGENWPELANIYRALLAMSLPARLDAEGGGGRALAALGVLERYV
ncbi:MAG: aminoglycoside phosphotransferase family protein [Planctomycetota bacterium]